MEIKEIKKGTEGIETEGAIIMEVAKVGREFLYKLCDKNYKNNALKLKTWKEIGEAVGLSKDECQRIWKNLKNKYKAALRSNKCKSGDAPKKKKPYTEWLLKEMEFLEDCVGDSEVTVTNWNTNPTGFQELFNQYANDTEVNQYSEPVIEIASASISECSTPTSSIVRSVSKKRKYTLDASETRINTYLETMENLGKSLVAPFSVKEKDPFILVLEREYEKVSQEKRNQLNLTLLNLIYNAQK